MLVYSILYIVFSYNENKKRKIQNTIYNIQSHVDSKNNSNF